MCSSFHQPERFFTSAKTRKFDNLNDINVNNLKLGRKLDVELLFTNIPIKEYIDFTCEKIDVHKTLDPIWKRPISKKLLYKLTSISDAGKFRKQIDDVFMGVTLSVTLSDCLMNKIERDIALALNQKSYRWFINDM